MYHVASSAGPKPAAAKPSGWGVRQVLAGEPTQPRVLLIGDSILGGYHAKAAELLRGKVKTRPIAFDPEFNPLIVERNQTAGKVMAENQVPVADYYGILATKLELAAGDRFHWTRPAYELLAQCAAAQIEQALPAVAAGKTGKKP